MQDRPIYKKPQLLTDRIETRCTPEEKDLIYQAAAEVGKPASRYVIEAAMHQAKQLLNQGASDE